MAESKAARGGGCRWIRYIGVLFQTIQAIACNLWATLLKPSDAPRRLLGCPPLTLADLQSDADIEGQSTSSCSTETMDHLDIASEVLEGNSSGRNEDLELGFTGASGLEQPPSCCSETKNSEIVLEPEVNCSSMHHHVLQELPKRVHLSGYTIPPGFEKSVWSARRNTASSAGVSAQPDLNVGSTTSDPPTGRPPESSSPTDSSIESGQVSSGCSDSDVVSEPEVIRDAICLARFADSVSGAEVERELHQDLFFSRSFAEFLSEVENKCDSIDRLCKAINASRIGSAPNLKRITVGSSSDSSDFDNLSDESDGNRNAALPSGNEGTRDLEETEISLSYSDTTDSDGLSEPDKQLSADGGTRESGAVVVAENSSTGISVAESELSVREEGSKGSELLAAQGRLNPNAKEFLPGAASIGACQDFLVHSEPQQSALRQKLELNGLEQLSLSCIEEKSFRPSSATGIDAPLDLGTALRMNFERVNNWTKWSQGPSVSSSDSEVVWGSGQKKACSIAHVIPPQEPDQDLSSASDNKSTTTSRQRRDRRQGRRPYYYPSTRVRKVKASGQDIKVR